MCFDGLLESRNVKRHGKKWPLLSKRTKISFYLWFWESDFSVQFSSVTQSCLTLCDPMDCSTPGLPVHHQLPEFTQTHVYRVSDAIQPSHPLLFSFPPTFNLSQHQGFFRWVSSTHQVAKVLEFQLQHQSVLQMNIQDWFPLGWTGWISLLSKELSRVFSTSQLKSINSSVLSFLYGPTLISIYDYWKNHSFG